MCPELKEEKQPFKSQTTKTIYMTKVFFLISAEYRTFFFRSLNFSDHLLSLCVGMWTKILYPCLWYETWHSGLLASFFFF